VLLCAPGSPIELLPDYYNLKELHEYNKALQKKRVFSSGEDDADLNPRRSTNDEDEQKAKEEEKKIILTAQRAASLLRNPDVATVESMVQDCCEKFGVHNFSSKS
jgi:hypothetical protein